MVSAACGAYYCDFPLCALPGNPPVCYAVAAVHECPLCGAGNAEAVMDCPETAWHVCWPHDGCVAREQAIADGMVRFN